MKTILIIILLFITFDVFSQSNKIGEVKAEGSYLKIYNEKGVYYASIYVSSNKLEGYNSKIIVVREGNYAKIYNESGTYTNSIYLGSSATVKHVSSSNILIQEGHSTKYYNFNGEYSGHSTYN